MGSITQSSVLNNIQFLRAFAALNVVVFDSIEAAIDHKYPLYLFEFFSKWRGIGVDLFFIISGFIMVYIQNIQNRSPFDLFKNRLSHIIPTYWILTLVLLCLFLLLPNAFRNMGISITSVITSLLFISGLNGDPFPILYVGWSIEYETLFYTLFAISLFFKTINNAILFTTTLLLIAVLVFNVNTIFFEFIFGMSIGWFYISTTFTLKHRKLFLLSAVIIFMVTILLKNIPIEHILSYGIPSGILLFASIYIKQIIPNFFSKLGDASYSIYLIQVFTIPVCFRIFDKINIAYKSDFSIIFATIITAIFSLFFYQIVEINIIKIYKKYF